MSIKPINNLAKNYEEFFLFKKMRNIEIGVKKNDFIKSFMNNTLQSDYLKYCEEVKQIKKNYDEKKSNKDKNDNKIITQKSIDNIPNKVIVEQQKNDLKEDDILNNIIISIGEEKSKFLGKKRKIFKLQNYN